MAISLSGTRGRTSLVSILCCTSYYSYSVIISLVIKVNKYKDFRTYQGQGSSEAECAADTGYYSPSSHEGTVAAGKLSCTCVSQSYLHALSLQQVSSKHPENFQTLVKNDNHDDKTALNNNPYIEEVVMFSILKYSLRYKLIILFLSRITQQKILHSIQVLQTRGP